MFRLNRSEWIKAHGLIVFYVLKCWVEKNRNASLSLRSGITELSEKTSFWNISAKKISHFPLPRTEFCLTSCAFSHAIKMVVAKTHKQIFVPLLTTNTMNAQCIAWMSSRLHVSHRLVTIKIWHRDSTLPSIQKADSWPTSKNCSKSSAVRGSALSLVATSKFSRMIAMYMLITMRNVINTNVTKYATPEDDASKVTQPSRRCMTI